MARGGPARLPGMDAADARLRRPCPTIGDALNARLCFIEVKCLGCETDSAVDLTIVRRPKETPVHELERWMRCKDCSKMRGYP